MGAYEGGREMADLQAHAKENLGPQCSPANIDLCNDEKKEMITKFMAMSDAELSSSIEEKNAKIKEADKEFNDLLEGLQKQYETSNKEKDEKIAAIKKSGLGLMKAVAAHNKNA